MKQFTYHDNPRISLFVEAFRTIQQHTDPWLVLHAFVQAIRETEGPRGYIRLLTRGLPEGHFRITRFQLPDERDVVEAAEWGARLDGLPVHSGGLLTELVRSPEPKIMNELDLHDDPVLGNELSECGALMAVPIHAKTEPADWLIVLGPRPSEFGEDDLTEAVLRANLICSTLDNLHIAEELRRAQHRIQQEVDQIAGIQQGLLAADLSNLPGIDAAASHASYDRAGGDYYRVIPLVPSRPDSHRWLFLIGDAAGHGASAAVVTALLHALLDRLPPEAQDAASVLGYLNGHMKSWNLPFTMVTAFCAAYDTACNELRYARAGHDYPLVKRGNSIQRLTAGGGPPLGVVSTAVYEETVLPFTADDTLLLYTDGITEAQGTGGSMLELEGLEDLFLSAPEAAQDCLDAIKQGVARYEAGRRPHDDQTLLVVRPRQA